MPAATLTVSGAGDTLAELPLTFAAVGDAVIAGTVDWPTRTWLPDGAWTTHDALGGPPFNE